MILLFVFVVSVFDYLVCMLMMMVLIIIFVIWFSWGVCVVWCGVLLGWD